MIDIIKAGVFDSSLFYRRGEQTPDRVTHYYELELYINGQGDSIIDEEPLRHEKGNVILARPGQRRYSTNLFTCYYVHFHTDEKTAAMIRDIPSFIQIHHFEYYEEVFLQVIRASENRTHENALLIQALLYELLFKLYNHGLYEVRKKASGDVPDTKVMKQAIAYMDEHYMEPIRLSDIAGSVGFSPTYFHKVFKIYTGKTPAAFLLEKRIQSAKTYLLTTDLSLNQVAEYAGFSSLAYFDYSFKKAVGMTPTEYRRQKYSL